MGSLTSSQRALPPKGLNSHFEKHVEAYQFWVRFSVLKTRAHLSSFSCNKSLAKPMLIIPAEQPIPIQMNIYIQQFSCYHNALMAVKRITENLLRAKWDRCLPWQINFLTRRHLSIIIILLKSFEAMSPTTKALHEPRQLQAN